jgi:hypothetical protein
LSGRALRGSKRDDAGVRSVTIDTLVCHSGTYPALGDERHGRMLRVETSCPLRVCPIACDESRAATDGATGEESPVSFTGEGDGALDGLLGSADRAVAGRWIGSGLRRGRLVFMMRAGTAGTYIVPVRFSRALRDEGLRATRRTCRAAPSR